MAEKLGKKTAETEEIAMTAEKTEGKKKKKGRKRRIVKRLIWTLVILPVVGVAVWSVYSRLKAEYKITYDPSIQNMEINGIEVTVEGQADIRSEEFTRMGSNNTGLIGSLNENASK